MSLPDLWLGVPPPHSISPSAAEVQVSA